MRNLFRKHKKYLLRITIIYIVYVLLLFVPAYSVGSFNALPFQGIRLFLPTYYLARFIDLPICNLFIQNGYNVTYYVSDKSSYCSDLDYGGSSPLFIVILLMVIFLEVVIFERIGILIVKFIQGRFSKIRSEK